MSRLHPTVAVAVALLATFGAGPAEAADTARLEALVRSSLNGVPIGDAELLLDLAPADAVAERTELTQPLGTSTLTGLAAGTWHVTITHPAYEPGEFDVTLAEAERRHETFELAPRAVVEGFQLTLQALDVRTSTPLPEAEFVVERWNGADVTGEPAYRRTFRSNGDGTAWAVDMRPGWYRVTTTRHGWEPLVHPASGAVRLQASHAAVAHLKPVEKSLRVIVGGYDPVDGVSYGDGNSDATVEVEGLSFDEQRVIVPSQVATTDAAGDAYVPGLAALPWRVTVRKPGYLTTTATWRCSKASWNANLCDTFRVGTGPGGNTSFRGWLLVVRPQWNPATLRLNLTSPYTERQFLRAVQAELTGLEGTPTEGVDQYGWNRTSATEAYVEFDDLPPGRYRLRAQADGGIDRYSNFTLPATPDDDQPSVRFQFRSRAFERIVEVAAGGTTVLEHHFEPEPLIIHGRVLSAESLARFDGAASGTTDRVFEPKSTQLVFRMHPGRDIVAPELRTVTVDTDARGNFVARLTPGIWGLQLPSLPNHAKVDLRRRVLSSPDGTESERSLGWPIVEGWTVATPRSWYDYSHGLEADGGETWELDVLIARRFVALTGSWSIQDPFWRAALRLDGQPVVGVSPFHLGTAALELRGPTTVRARLGRGKFEFDDVGPGTYALALDATGFELEASGNSGPVSGVTVTVPGGAAPGFAPSLAELRDDPEPASRVGLTSLADASFTFRNTQVGTYPTVTLEYWTYDSNLEREVYVGYPGSRPATFYESPLAPGFVLEAPSGQLPAPPCTAYFRFTDAAGIRWVSRGCNAAHEYTIKADGPEAEPSAAQAPPLTNAYRLLARTFLPDDSERNGVRLRLAPGADGLVTSGVEQTTAHDATGGATSEDAGWTASLSGCRGVPSSPPMLDCSFRISRNMIVSGVVRRPGGVPAAGVQVQVLDRAGKVLREQAAAADGTFRLGAQSFSGIGARPVWVQVRVPGFAPIRRRFDVLPPASPDVLGIELDLVALPRPTFPSFTFDRFGGVLQGVSRGAEPDGRFGEATARAAVTGTWQVEVQPAQVSYTLDALDPQNTGVPRPEQITEADVATSVIVTDRRSFDSRGYPGAESATEVDVAALADPAAARTFLGAVTTGRRDASTFFVVAHSEGRSSETGWRGTLPLHSLPPGEFRPLAFVQTRLGVVGLAEYETPEGKPPLTVLPLPEWLSLILDVCGAAAANLPAAEFKDLFPKNMFAPQPEFAGSITVADDQTLTYGYSIGVIVAGGTKAPTTGLLSVAPKLLGAAVKGTVGVSFAGADHALGVTIGGAVGKDFAEEGGLAIPGAFIGGNDFEWKKPARSPISLEKLEYTASVAGEFKSTLQAGPSEYQLTLTMEGFGDYEVGVDLSPVLRLIPYAGPVFLGLQSIGIWFQARLINGSGLRQTRVVKFTPRARGGTQTARAPRFHLFGVEGELTATSDTAYLVKAGAALSARLGSETGDANGGLQLGAPQGGSGGLAVTINDLGTWPPIKRIEGAGSLFVRGKLKLPGLQLTRGAQFDAIRIDWQPNTEAYFDLVATNAYSNIVTALDAPPAAWAGQGGTLVRGFFGGGDARVGGGAQPGFVFTQTTGAGTMQLLVSDHAGGFGTPIVAAEGAAIGAVALTQRAGGGRAVVYAETAADRIGDPRAPSTIRIVTQDAAGGTWSAPATVLERPSIVDRIWATAAGDTLVVVFSEATAGATEPGRTLFATSLRDGAWSTVTTLLADDAFRSGSLAAAPGSAAEAVFAVVTSVRELEVHAFDGTAWEETAVGSSDRATVSVAFDDEGLARIAAGGAGGGLALFRRDAVGGPWTALGDVPFPISAVELAFVPMRDGTTPASALVWIDTDGATLHWAWIGDDGTAVEGPSHLTTATGGLAQLAVLPLDEQRPAVRAIYRFDDGAATRVEERRLALGQAPQEPGDAGTGGDEDAGVGGEDDAGIGGSDDAGSLPGEDGGTTTEPGPDGGEPLDPGPETPAGCGCGAAGSPLAAALLAVGVRRRRRR